jgi:hypothetical protein
VVLDFRRREEASQTDRTDRAFVREWRVEHAVLAEGVPGPDTAVLPFTVSLPRTAPSTLHTAHTRVRWLLYLRLPGMDGDVYGVWEINVHTGL